MGLVQANKPLTKPWKTTNLCVLEKKLTEQCCRGSVDCLEEATGRLSWICAASDQCKTSRCRSVGVQFTGARMVCRRLVLPPPDEEDTDTKQGIESKTGPHCSWPLF